MKKTVLAATVVFWCFMIAAVIAGNVSEKPAPVAQVPVTVAPAPAPALKQYTLKDVAQHATPKNCWMAIGGRVYDFSAYIPQHPAAPEVMTRHCGKEATHAFNTKDIGRPHTGYAKSLLAQHQVGILRD